MLFKNELNTLQNNIDAVSNHFGVDINAPEVTNFTYKIENQKGAENSNQMAA